MLNIVEEKLDELGIEHEKEPCGEWWKVYITNATIYCYDDSFQIFTIKNRHASEVWKEINQTAIDKFKEFGKGKLYRWFDLP